jgi:enoyl-CoA hydratase
MNPQVIFEREGRLEWIIINNPAKSNCLTRQMIQEMITHLDSLWHDDGIDAILFTGSGERSFAAGINVTEFLDLTPETARELITELKTLCERVRKIPHPVIMAINGYCIGGALELVMAADIRIATTNSSFAMPEIKMGIPSVIDAALLQQYVGLSLAKEMLLTGDLVGVEQMNAYGFLNKVVRPEELKEVAVDYAQRIASHAKTTIATQKRLFETWQNSFLDYAIQDSIKEFALSFVTDIPQKKVKEFLSSKK